MHSLSLRRRLAALLLLPLLLLAAGCARVTADFDITSADSYTLDFDMAVEKSYVESEFSSADEMCQSLQDEGSTDEFGTATWKPYTESDLWGCKISGTVSKEDFGSDFTIEENDGKLHLQTAPDSSYDLSSTGFDASDLDLTITFSFPGKVLESNVGTVDGKTVTITDLNDLGTGIDITAEAGDIGAGLIILIVALIVVLLIAVIVIALIVFLVVRSRRKKNAQNAAGDFGGPAAGAEGFGGHSAGGDFGGPPAGGGGAGGTGSASPSGYPGGGYPGAGQSQGQQDPSQQWSQGAGQQGHGGPQGQSWQQGQNGEPGQSGPSWSPAPAPQGEQPWSRPPSQQGPSDQQGQSPQGQQPWQQSPMGQQAPQGQQPWNQQPPSAQPGQGSPAQPPQWGQPSGQESDGDQPWSRPPQS